MAGDAVPGPLVTAGVVRRQCFGAASGAAACWAGLALAIGWRRGVKLAGQGRRAGRAALCRRGIGGGGAEVPGDGGAKRVQLFFDIGDEVVGMGQQRFVAGVVGVAQVPGDVGAKQAQLAFEIGEKVVGAGQQRLAAAVVRVTVRQVGDLICGGGKPGQGVAALALHLGHGVVAFALPLHAVDRRFGAVEGRGCAGDVALYAGKLALDAVERAVGGRGLRGNVRLQAVEPYFDAVQSFAVLS